MGWWEPKAAICPDTGLPVPCIGYSGLTRNAPKLTDEAAGGRQGETGEGNLATVTDVALIGCGGSGWRWRMNLLNSLNRFISLPVLGMPGWAHGYVSVEIFNPLTVEFDKHESI